MTDTQHYQLNQWAADDQVLRTDFNADNAKIDAALGEHAQKLEWLDGIGVERGTYVGTGVAGPDAPTTLTFSGKPILVFVGGGGCCAATMIRPSTLSYNIGLTMSDQMILSWGENSITWYATPNNVNGQMTVSGTTYAYFAMVEPE